ncbi:MAG TPA: SWIM zinc finger family protein, partial [Urbifossiella sp.]|nr:SWIM zinc finger family protein [Urbifossiella sp.]
MGISTALASHVSSPVRERGKTYFRAGAVHLSSVGPKDVAATVSGTDEYEVDVVVDGRTVHAWCTCPYISEYGAVCKHIWAAVLAAEARGFGAALTGPLRLVLEGDEDDDDPDDSTLEFEPKRRERKPRAAPREAWLDQLDTLRRQLEPGTTPPPHERLVVYVLDASGGAVAPQLTVETAVSERKKNGDWGKPQTRTIAASDVSRLTDAVDRRLLTLLDAAEPAYRSGGWYGYSPAASSRSHVNGPLLDIMLPLLAESGRVRLRTQAHADLRPLTFDDGPPWELAVDVARDPGGKEWLLTGALRRGDDLR